MGNKKTPLIKVSAIPEYTFVFKKYRLYIIYNDLCRFPEQLHRVYELLSLNLIKYSDAYCPPYPAGPDSYNTKFVLFVYGS